MATTTIITNPDFLSPINSIYGNTFVLNNTSSAALNFKYVTRVYANGSFLVQELTPPRPLNGYGQYSPQKSLLSQVSYNLTQALTTPTESTNGIVRYQIGYGYQYNPNLTIDTLLSVFTSSTSYFGFSFSTATGLTVGDTITIQSDNPYYSGTSSITQILTANSFVINKLFTATSSVSTGIVSNATRIEGTSSTFYGYNGTRQYSQASNNFYNTNVVGNTVSTNTKPFLTNYPSTYKYVLSTNYETISALLYTPNFISGGSYSATRKYSFYNSSNSLISSTSSNFTLTRGATPSIQFWNIPVGPGQLTLPTNTDNYSVTLYFGSTTYSETRFYKIDTECSIYNNVRVMFMNRYGAFDYFNFRKDDQKNYNIIRNEYKQELPWNYSIGDRERTILSQKVEETHIINSDWVNENDYAWLSELVSSTEVYIVDDTTHYAYPILITDTAYTFKTANRDKIFNLTVSYVYSYNVETQNQ